VFGCQLEHRLVGGKRWKLIADGETLTAAFRTEIVGRNSHLKILSKQGSSLLLGENS
jgi:hypothetical protein